MRIIPVGDIKQAYLLKNELPDSLLIGEREGKMIEGFDYGNSPSEIKNIDLSGKTIIHTTHAGTQGLVNAKRASHVFTGAFVNAGATARYIRSLSPATVTLVRMGHKAQRRCDEDDLCAEYLESLLLDKVFNKDDIKPLLKKSPFSARFFDPAKPWSPAADFDLCLDVDRFGFALQALEVKNNRLYLERYTYSGQCNFCFSATHLLP